MSTVNYFEHHASKQATTIRVDRAAMQPGEWHTLLTQCSRQANDQCSESAAPAVGMHRRVYDSVTSGIAM